MSLSIPHGQNSNLSIAAVVPRTIDVMSMQLFYAAYQQGSDGFLKSWWDFSHEVNSGHIVLATIDDEDEYRSVFGLELMHDREGPYLNLMFYVGRLSVRLVGELTWWIFEFAQLYKQQERADLVRLKIGGRKGWRAFVKRMGLEMDQDGFISEYQEVFYHGRFGRLQ